jgi:hypothetical protein
LISALSMIGDWSGRVVHFFASVFIFFGSLLG